MTKEATKVVVRLLPPEITEKELLDTINTTHVQAAIWTSFHPGKRYKGEAKPSRNARCYFKFESQEQVDEFTKDFHGHIFVDSHGEQFRAVVCVAPYQKVPRQKLQKDNREGTLQDDPAFKEFLAQLAEPKKPFEAPEDPKKLFRPTDLSDTPLIQYFKDRSKDRERQRAEKLAKKRQQRWRGDGLNTIMEEPKKKWRCAECGTSKHLEEDPDDRGTFYCTRCWEAWEAAEVPAQKSKKKKKKGKDEWEEEEEDDYSKKKKKKKDKYRDYDDEPTAQWRVKEPSSSKSTGYEEEEEADARAKRKKKKDKDYEEGEDDGSSRQRWRIKDDDEDYTETKRKSKKEKDYTDWWDESAADDRRRPRKDKAKESEWWEDTGSRKSRREKDWWDEGAKGSRWEESEKSSSGRGGARWKVKGTDSEATSEDKPRRGRRDKDD